MLSKNCLKVNQHFFFRGGGREVKAVDCKSIGKPALVRIQSTSIFFNFLKKKNAFKFKKINQILKKSKETKLSFIFLFFFKKKIFLPSTGDFFFFYNNFFSIFLKKVFVVFSLFKDDLVFVADNFFNAFSNIRDLNFLFSKKNFLFFFLSDLSLSSLTSNLGLFNQSGGLAIYTRRPDTYQVFLPVVLDYSFSLYFYKFFFFKLITV